MHETTPAPLPPFFEKSETLWGDGNYAGYVEAFLIPNVGVGFKIYYYNWSSYAHANLHQRVAEHKEGAYWPWQCNLDFIPSPYVEEKSAWDLIKASFTEGDLFGIKFPPQRTQKTHYDSLKPRAHIFAFGDFFSDGVITFASIPSYYSKADKMKAGTELVPLAEIITFPIVAVEGNSCCFQLFADCVDGASLLLVSGFIAPRYSQQLQARMVMLAQLAQQYDRDAFLERAEQLVAQKMR